MVKNRFGSKVPETLGALPPLNPASREYPDEAGRRRSGGQCVINIVAEVEGVCGVAAIQDLQKALGVRFRQGDILDCHQAAEVAGAPRAAERVLQLSLSPTREDSELGSTSEVADLCLGQQPSFVPHVTIAVLAPIQFDELSFHFPIFRVRP
jgi:hypothetical protein